MGQSARDSRPKKLFGEMFLLIFWVSSHFGVEIKISSAPFHLLTLHDHCLPTALCLPLTSDSFHNTFCSFLVKYSVLYNSEISVHVNALQMR